MDDAALGRRVMAAIVIWMTLTGSAWANQVAARTWPDTTDGIYIFNDQLASYMTDAQFQFSATRYSGCQKMLRSDADKLRSYNSNFLILHYRLGLGLGYRTLDGSWLYIIEGNNWVREWPDSPQDQWFYPYGGSDRVYQHEWGWYLIEPDNASWRTYWTGEVTRQIAANDDDGLFADSTSVPNYLGADSFTPPLPAYDPPFEAAWSTKIANWITYVKGVFGTDRKLIPNVGYWVTTRDATDYSGADGVMIEGFAEWSEGSQFDLADWQLQMNRMLSLIRQGKTVIAQAYIDDPSNTTNRMYLLANYLLIKGTKTFINMEMGMDPEWFPEYGVSIGPYLGAIPTQISNLYRSDWGVYARQYTGGMALVNPSDVSRTVNLPSGYRRVVPHGGGLVPEDGNVSMWYITTEPVSSLTMPAYSGAVVVSPGVLAVTPTTSFTSSGPPGGPFMPSSEIYTLRNTGGQDFNWTASHIAGITWLALSNTSGTLAPSAQTTMTASITSSATSLGSGTYNDTISFVNATTGEGNTIRSVTLTVQSGEGRLAVTPTSSLVASGPAGGPFSPDRLDYTVANIGDSAIDFSITHEIAGNWLTIYCTLAAHESRTVTALINALANSLTPGTYTDTITFTNLTNGQGNTTRMARIMVTGTASLQVTPTDGFDSSGAAGGPFAPTSKQYTLTNTGTVSMNWTASHTPSATWATLSSTSGTLASGASATVTVSINSNANSLPIGTYNDTVSFVNTTSGSGNTTRGITLTISAKTLTLVDVYPTTIGCPSTDPRQIYATAYFSDSSTADVTSVGTWTSSAPSVATVSSGVVTPKVDGTTTATCTYTYGGLTRSDYCSVKVDFERVLYLYVSPTGYVFRARTPKQFTCLARLGNSTWLTVTDQCQWSSSSRSVFDVDQRGVVTPISSGQAYLTATYIYNGAQIRDQELVKVQLY